MIFYSVSKTSSGTSDWIRMDKSKAREGKYTLLLSLTGTATADVEFTVDEDLTSATAISHSVLSSITSTTASDMLTPVSGFRINVSSYTSGTVTLKVVQQ